MPRFDAGPSFAPPRSEEAEQAVLGAMLLEREAIAVASGLLTAADFYREAHAVLFRVMVEFHAETGVGVDAVVVAELLEARGQLEIVGGREYLALLLNAAPTAASIGRYGGIVKDKARLRDLASAGWRLTEAAQADGADPAELAGRLAVLAEELGRESGAEEPPVSAGDLVAQARPAEWLVTGLVPARSLVIMAGDAGLGKTWIGCDLACAIASGGRVFGHFASTQARVVYWDEENGAAVLANRLKALTTSTNGLGVEFLTDRGWSLTDPPVIRRLERVIRAAGARLLIVDSFRAVHDLDENSSRDMQPLMNRLVRFVRSTDCSVWLLHHASKPSMIGPVTASRLSRGSTAIRAACDCHLFLKRVGRDDLVVEVDKCRVSSDFARPFVLRFEELEEERIALTYAGLCEDLIEPTDRAKELILEVVSEGDGSVTRPALLDRCKQQGISKRTSTRALGEMVEEGALVKGERKGHAQVYRVNVQASFDAGEDPFR